MKIGSASFRRKVVDLIPSETISTLALLINATTKQAKSIYGEKLDALRNGDETVAEKVGSGKDILSILRTSDLL